jgi:hypothetical protein
MQAPPFPIQTFGWFPECSCIHALFEPLSLLSIQVKVLPQLLVPRLQLMALQLSIMNYRYRVPISVRHLDHLCSNSLKPLFQVHPPKLFIARVRQSGLCTFDRESHVLISTRQAFMNVIRILIPLGNPYP